MTQCIKYSICIGLAGEISGGLSEKLSFFDGYSKLKFKIRKCEISVPQNLDII